MEVYNNIAVMLIMIIGDIWDHSLMQLKINHSLMQLKINHSLMQLKIKLEDQLKRKEAQAQDQFLVRNLVQHLPPNQDLAQDQAQNQAQDHPNLVQDHQVQEIHHDNIMVIIQIRDGILVIRLITIAHKQNILMDKGIKAVETEMETEKEKEKEKDSETELETTGKENG
jgi:hypothetical protein